MFDLLDFSQDVNFTCTINGHLFKCHLLDMGEQMEAGTLSAPYMDTPVLDSVLKCATFALSVDSIDGQPLYEPVMASNAPVASEKFEQASKIQSWWINKWFEAYSKKHDEYDKKLSSFKKK